MTARKERLTVTVDRALIRAANESVARGDADSLSAWVNTALAERVAKEARLRALADAITHYEAEFGPISAADLAARKRADLRSAIVISPTSPTRRRPREKRRRAAA
jgi:hypothetical protein